MSSRSRRSEYPLFRSDSFPIGPCLPLIDQTVFGSLKSLPEEAINRQLSLTQFHNIKKSDSTTASEHKFKDSIVESLEEECDKLLYQIRSVLSEASSIEEKRLPPQRPLSPVKHRRRTRSRHARNLSLSRAKTNRPEDEQQVPSSSIRTQSVQPARRATRSRTPRCRQPRDAPAEAKPPFVVSTGPGKSHRKAEIRPNGIVRLPRDYQFEQQDERENRNYWKPLQIQHRETPRAFIDLTIK